MQFLPRFPIPPLWLPCVGQRLGAVVTLLMGLTFTGATSAQSLTWSGHLGLASDLVVRGLQLSEGHSPVWAAGLQAYAAPSWSMGFTALRLRDPQGRWADAGALHLGYEWPLDAHWKLLADLQHTRYAHSPLLQGWGGTQFALSLAHGDRWSLTWNIDHARDPALAARSLDTHLRWPLTDAFSLTASAGRVLAPGGGYRYAQAGLVWHSGGWQLRLDRSATSTAARLRFGEQSAPRWIGSTTWLF